MKYFDTTSRGKFIVIYGPNNIGKSTHFGNIAANLVRDYHQQLLFLKYPIYDLKPTGPLIYDYTKGKKVDRGLDIIRLQELYAKNRLHFQHIVEKCLKSGIHVIAEDYVGTGLAWGLTYNAKLTELLQINNYLLMPDLSILLTGKRFKKAIEKKHIFENAGDDIWEKNKRMFLKLAKKYRWIVVDTDATMEEANSKIKTIVLKELNLNG